MSERQRKKKERRFAMKKILTITGVVMLVLAVSYPLYARGPGWGSGDRFMRDGWGPGPQWGYNHPLFRALTEDERSKLEALHKEFRDETSPLRDKMVTKTRELYNILNSPDPDAPKARAIQKEISDLRAQLAQKRLDFLINVKKIVPKDFFAHEFGMGQNRGFGPRWMY
jgi:zinc resistance-associated protein